MQGLQDHGVPLGEQGGHPVVAHLVGDLGPDPAAAGEGRGVDDHAVAGQPDEGGAQPAPGQQLVDAVEVEQVAEAVRVGARREQRAAAPVLGCRTSRRRSPVSRDSDGRGRGAGRPVVGRPALLTGSVRSAGTAVRAPVRAAVGDTRGALAGAGVGRALGPAVRAAVLLTGGAGLAGARVGRALGVAAALPSSCPRR